MADAAVESPATLDWVQASTAALIVDVGNVRGVPQGFRTALKAFVAGDDIPESEELWHAVETLTGQPLVDYYGPVPEPLAWIRASALTLLAECDHAVAEAQDSFDEADFMARFPILYRRVDRIERAHVALGEAIEHLKAHAAGTAVTR
jgi:hypothetical protein